MKETPVAAFEMSKEHEAFCNAIRSMIRSSEKLFKLSEVEIVGLLGSIVGAYASCSDDIFAHDDKLIAEMQKASIEHDCAPTLKPCYETLLMNVDFAYHQHTEMHNAARKGMNDGDEMLQKVCESHKKGH